MSEVVDPGDVATQPHLAARGTYVVVDGALQPAPAPRFSLTDLATPEPAPTPGADTAAVLRELGLDPEHYEAVLEPVGTP